MIFKHEYTDLNVYMVKGSDGRVWDKTDELYLEFCKTNTPEKVSGDRFIIINPNGVVTVDPNKESILLAEIQEEVTKETEILQRETDINTNLPTWQKVSGEIDGITSLAGAKVALKKIARVVYWLAKNQLE